MAIAFRFMAHIYLFSSMIGIVYQSQNITLHSPTHVRPQRGRQFPLAKSITAAAGRCLFPHRQIYHICRRQMSIPPRYLWRGGGRQAGGEVRELGIEIKGQNPTARPIEMRSSYRSTDRNAIERATAEQFHRVYIDRYRPRNTAVRVHRLSPYDNR